MLVHNDKTKQEDNKLAQGEHLLVVKNLSISIKSNNKKLTRNLNLTIRPGEMLGLVGESGSGKSLAATAVLGLLPQSLEITSGSIRLEQCEITSSSEKQLREIRGRDIAYLSQNYQSFFTPYIKIGKQFIEVIQSHTKTKRLEAKEIAIHWLNKVNLPAERVFNSYPSELSGGQLQRASIAAAIMFRPKLIIADEPTTALDVITGDGILDLLSELQQELDCSILLISHDLKHIINRTTKIAVMYGGQIVETGKTSLVEKNPVHPYTKLLLQSRLKLTTNVPRELPSMFGEPGQLAEAGCAFASRCPKVMKSCSSPPPTTLVRDHHSASCHLLDSERIKLYARG